MKTKTLCLFFATLLFVGVFQFTGCQTPNRTTSIQESWESISNRLALLPILKIKNIAERGDIGAQYYLASAYYSGNGVIKDQGEAFKWMNLAAQKGMIKAQRRLGWMFQNGSGVATNLDEAVVWYQKAAQQSDMQSQFNLGWMYENGTGVLQDYTEAAKFYRLAAQQGHAMAQNNLGFLYYQGLGVPQDSAEAKKWYQKSAEQGEALGEENLGWMYRYANGDDPNFDLSEKWMKLAAEQGSAEAQYQFGFLLAVEYDKSGHEIPANFPAEAEWYGKSAEQGYAKAQCELAEMYHNGQLGEDQRSNCIPWFIKAAAQGNAKAQSELSELKIFYPNSKLLKSVDALEMLRRGAEDGDLDAQIDLAQRYQTGDGVPKNAVEAFKWMQKAAQNDAGSSLIGNAIYELALMYEKGEGVTQDLAEARSLFLSASDIGNSDASFRAGQMYENGDGVPQNDEEATQHYENMYLNNYRDFGYTNSGNFIATYGPTQKSIESLYRLWSQGRGFPSSDMKKTSGYADPDASMKKYWIQFVTTARTEFYVGEIYYQGKLVTQDLIEADARFRFAANQGLDDARKMADEVESKMSLDQIEAAKNRLDALGKLFAQINRTQNDARSVEEALEKVNHHVSK